MRNTMQAIDGNSKLDMNRINCGNESIKQFYEERLMAEAKNMEKHARYRSQFERLNLAMENKFYLEAIFIEYAILEDKAWSALKHAGYDGCEKTDGLERKLDSVKALRKSTDLAAKYLSLQLIGDVKCWKNDRNKLVHNLMETELETKKLRGLAVRGRKLVDTFGGKVSQFNRALGRRKS